ncbi:MAG: hypothetical protein LBL84_02680, partial [Candidatus Nomurabacteria bacterium]|nr:hypothetical protein [Candidatus Nomurabacteria bacterium]
MENNKNISTNGAGAKAHTPVSAGKPATTPPKKRKGLPVKKIILTAIAVAAVAVGVLAALTFLLPGKTLKSEIKIGDTIITKADIDAYEKDLGNYKELFKVEFPEQTEGKLTLRQIAENDLLFNAGFKHYAATKCNNPVSSKDFDDIADTGFKSYRTRAENKIYKQKLASCLIKQKDVFEVSASAASMAATDKSEQEKTFKEVENYFREHIYPLFEKNLSRDEIIKQVDVYQTYSPGSNADGDWASTDYSSGKYSKLPNGMPITANYYKPWSGESTCPGETNAIGQQATCKYDTVQGLKTGEHSQVLATSDNFYSVVRVEGVNSGEFDSWSDFIEKIKEEFGYSQLSVISHTVKYLAAIGLDSILGTKYAEAKGLCGTAYTCPGCYDISFAFYLTDQADAKISVPSTSTYGILQTSAGWGVCNWSNERWGLTFNTKYQAAADGSSGGIINCGFNLPQISVSKGWKSFRNYSGSPSDVSYYCPDVSGYSAQSLSWSATSNSGGIDGWDISYSPAGLGINSNNAFMNVTCKYKPTATWQVTARIERSTGPTVDYKKDNGQGVGKVVWTHYAHENKGYASGTVTINADDRINATNGATDGDNNPPNPVSFSQSVAANSDSAKKTSSYTFTKDTVGKKVCRRSANSPISAIDYGWSVTSNYCATAYSPWAVSATSSISSPAVGSCRTSDNKTKPNCTITFSHTVKESNDRVIKKDDGSWQQLQYKVQTSTDNGATWDNPAWTNGAAQVGESGNVWTGTKTFNITEDHVGKYICQRVVSSDTARGDTTDKASTKACIYIPHNYNTTPTISIDDRADNSVIEPGNTIENTKGTVTNIDNASGTTLGTYRTKTYPGSKYQITNFIINPGGDLTSTAARQNSSDPCANYKAITNDQSKWKSCVNLKSGDIKSGSNNFLNPADIFTDTYSKYIIPDDTPVGARICFALSINTYIQFTNGTNNASTWSHSQPKCLRVGKSPKVQTHGGGVSAPGGISTKLTTRLGATTNPGIFGSWS